MSKNLTWKIVLIIVLVVLAVWTLYPPNKTLMPGIDLAGGTSLIYEIDTHGLKEVEKKRPGAENDNGSAQANRPGQHPESCMATAG